MIPEFLNHIAPLSLALLAFAATPLAHLRPLDIAVVAIYFGMVIWIGFYLKGRFATQPLRENDVYFIALALEQQ